MRSELKTTAALNVLVHLGALVVHAHHDAANTADNGAHDVVDHERMILDQAFKILAVQGKHGGITDGAQGGGMRFAIEKAGFARQIAGT